MLNKILRTIEKCIPKRLYETAQPTHHRLLAYAGASRYGFPSKKIVVIGVTGTKGKTSTTELIANIFRVAGEKVALANGIHFVVDEEETKNIYKMSMPGRFFIHRFIRNAVEAGCTYVVIEMTSEGAKQFRHKGIYLDMLIFTNLAPEHIEAHGSFEKYKAAKVSLMESLNPKKTSKSTYLVANADDEEVDAFLTQPVGKVITFSDKDIILAKKDEGHLTLLVGKTTLYTKLFGTFNAKNILAAIKVARIYNISEEDIKEGIESVEKIPGRAERIVSDPYEVYVDYAHTPDSLVALYSSFPDQHKVCVLGNTGGGRDTWKRPEMA
jgi:UDP-N-acetylmuramoyl-L-alanyl-D-glutamate--2,6-diaminopimelate ligase